MESGATAVVGRGLVEILPDFRKWGAELAGQMRLAKRQMDGTAAGFRRSAATVGGAMASTGKGVSALGVGVAAVSVKMAGDFQAHTAILQTAAGETASGLKVVRAGILDIAKGTGTPIQNLTDGMYQVEKAGYRGADGLKVLNAAAQGAKEEGAKLSDVTNAMTSVMASYHLKATDSVRVMNAMKTAAGEGKITMEEFSGALSTVLPIASANKISFADVAGSMATLTQHGTSAREATHELAATIRALAAPNNVASREMARFGLDANDVSTHLGKRGLSGTVEYLSETILKHMGPSGTRLQNIFEGTKQSARDAQIMIAHLPKELQGAARGYLTGTIEADKWNATVKGSDTRYAPMLRNFKTLVDRSHGFSAELKRGGPSVQTYTDALKKMSGGAIGLNTVLQLTGESADGNDERIQKVSKSFNHASKEVEGWKTTQGLFNTQLARAKATVQVFAIQLGTKLLPMITEIVGVIGSHPGLFTDLLIGIAGLAGVLMTAYVAQKLWAVATAISTAAQWAWNVATQEGGAGILLLRAQLAALFVWTKLQAAWTGIVTAAQWAWNVAMDANPIGLIVIAIAALVAGIVWVATKTNFFQTVWKATWGFVKSVFTGFVGWFKRNWQLITFTIMTLGIGLAVAMIVRHWDGVKHAFSATIDWVQHHWPLLLAILTLGVSAAVTYIIRHWDGIKKGAASVYHAVIDWFVRIGKDIGGFFETLPGILGRFFTQKVPAFFSSMWKAISGWFSKLPGRIWGALLALGNLERQVGSVLTSTGKNLIAGLWHGAVTFFTKSVPGFFKTLWHGIVDYFKAVFGIKSPSTVMAGLGRFLIDGLFGGMLRSLQNMARFMNTYVVQPIRHFFTKVIPDAASSMKGLVIKFWQAEVNGLLAIYHWMRDHVFNPIGNFFTHTIPGWGSAMRNSVLNKWGSLRDGLYGVYRWISSRVFSPLGNFFTRTIPNWASTMKGRVVGFFGDMRDGLGRAWSGIQNKAKSPINWVLNHVWNHGIYSVWDKIAGWIGIHNNLHTVKLLAAGGTTGNAGVYNRPTAIVGEGNPQHPEFVIPTDPKYRGRAMRLWQAAGAHFYESGGILGTISHALSSVGSKALNFGKGALDFLTDPSKIARKLFSGALSGLSRAGTSPWAKGIEQLPHRAVDGLLDAVKKIASSALGAGGNYGGGKPGAGVQQWAPVTRMILRLVGQPMSLLNITLRRMNQESGGNPNIVNTWDSNWLAGYPSVGLMQVIRPTFQRFAGPYRNTGPFKYGVSVNPAANIYASMKYALAAYGSLARAYGRAGGYGLGTNGTAGGLHMFGEHGPELAASPSGWRVLNARRTAALAAGGGITIERLVLENHGVIGSKREVEDWLVESLDGLRRKGRL